MTACVKCGHDSSAVVAAVWRLSIPRRVRSGNEDIHNAGGARWTYRKERLRWVSDMTGLRLVHRIPLATTKRRVTLSRIYGKGKRAYDRDNLATGCKPIVDAMVKAGILIGDRPDQAEIHYEQARGDGDMLRVLVEELAA